MTLICPNCSEEYRDYPYCSCCYIKQDDKRKAVEYICTQCGTVMYTVFVEALFNGLLMEYAHSIPNNGGDT